MSFLHHDIQTRKEKVLNHFVRAGGVIPPDPAECNDIDDSDSVEEEISGGERLARAVTKLSGTRTQKPRHHLLYQRQYHRHSKNRRHRQKPKPTPRNQYIKKSRQPNTFSNLPKSIQDRLPKKAHDQLPEDYNYKTNNKFIIRIKTDTPRITHIRSHLFDLRQKHGYEYANPMETTVCTLETDETQRIVYVGDSETKAQLTEFLKSCYTNKIINFLTEPTHNLNPTYDHDTRWE